jgi:hypothetical protein
MKVIGIGNPAALTLRLREREVKGLDEELRHRAAVAEDAQATGTPLVRVDRKSATEVIVAVAALRDRLATTSPNEQGRVVVTGPTWLLGPAIIGTTLEASEQLAGAMRRFVDGDGCAAVELREAVSDAAAWSETLIGYDHVENYGSEV